jgi:hypothetical protein
MRQARDAALAGELRSTFAMCESCDYPMRSSVRLELEAAFAGDDAPPRAFPVASHESEIRLGPDGPSLKAMVFDIEPDEGFVDVAVAAGPAIHALLQSTTAALRLAGAGGERFSFGSLAAIWCPVETVERREVALDAGVCLRVRLNRSTEAARLLPWYRAEWEHAPTAPAPQRAPPAP